MVPTYRRTKDLERCLSALKRQSCLPDQVLVIVRNTDDETHEFFDIYDFFPLPLRLLTIEQPGVIAAMNLGLEHTTSDVVAITDDDAEPHSDWLQKIKDHFLADEAIGAVGGRDWVYENDSQTPLRTSSDSLIEVGKLTWFGRAIGNHHIGNGVSREVDFLKGVNSSYRKDAIQNLRFDSRLKGTGAQVHHEMGFCLLLKRQGWKIIYDPSIAVNHYPASRFDEDQRNSFNFEAYYNAAYNQSLILACHFSKLQFVTYLLWSVLIGTRGCFGIGQAIRFIFLQRERAIYKWIAAALGHIDAVKNELSPRSYDLPESSEIQTYTTDKIQLISSKKS
jgi:glycosyltransferase involved in cell wall biosynthesis